MNALAEDASDTQEPFTSPYQTINVENVSHTWLIALEPGLQMGLDVDLSRTGRLAIAIGTTASPQVATTVEARVYVEKRGEDAVEVARMAATKPVDLLPQSSHLYEGDLVPSPSADLVPFEPGRNLYLEVTATTKTPSLLFAERPFLAPGGHFSLPLLEFHDPVDDALKSLDGPGLSPLGAQERLVNPGKAIVFPFSLANPAAEDRSYHVEVSGSNHEWSALPSDRIKVAAHATATGQLIVRAPSGAVDGDRADLILQAYDTADPTARGLLRLLAEVDTDEQHPDDTVTADELSKQKESPSAAVGLAALALAGVAGWLRRRR